MIGIIAGGGDLPALLIQACISQQRPFFILAYKGQTDPSLLVDVPHVWLSLGEIGKAFDILKQNNVTHVVMGGKFQRPSLKNLQVDWKGALFIARAGTALLGDDQLLRLLMEVIEKEGFQVIGAQEILKSLLHPPGPLGDYFPDAQALEDIKSGQHVLRTLSPLDIGQAVVVQQGIVLGVEAAEGTDQLIQRCGPLQKPGSKGVLVKMAKRGQDERVDLPTLGPETLKRLSEAGLAGVAFQADKTLILHPRALRSYGNEKELFVMGIQAL